MIGQIALVAILVLPWACVALLGLLFWLRDGWKESLFSRSVALAFSGLCVAAFFLLVAMLQNGGEAVEAPLGAWFTIGEYTFDWTLVGDRLSLPFALFSGALAGLIGAFSRRYVHQEPGFFRFYFLLALFGAGVELVVLAGSLDHLFIGWEIVGLTSALLIAFFSERKKPVEHGLMAFLTYRLCDIGLLAAVVWMHHTAGTAKLVGDLATEPWLGFPVPESQLDATIIGLLLVWASMGKSAQVPLGGWLPRAMEGPTPSSAIFYGAISVHLGPYMLLRAAPLLEASPLVAWVAIVIGVLTALHGTFVGRVQTDIKSALAYASMTQVGLIIAEIGFGFRYLALIHIVGHAALRTLQILRSPSLLHDHHHLEQAMGDVLPRTGAHLERIVPKKFQPWLYRHALERGYFDALLRDGVVGTGLRVLRWFDRIDQRWAAWLAGDDGTGRRASPSRGGQEL